MVLTGNSAGRRLSARPQQARVIQREMRKRQARHAGSRDPVATGALAVLLDMPGAQVRGAVSQMSRAGLVRRDDTGKWLLTLGANGAEA
jgi:hypothetical protein